MRRKHTSTSGPGRQPNFSRIEFSYRKVGNFFGQLGKHRGRSPVILGYLHNGIMIRCEGLRQFITGRPHGGLLQVFRIIRPRVGIHQTPVCDRTTCGNGGCGWFGKQSVIGDWFFGFSGTAKHRLFQGRTGQSRWLIGW